jgi:hypothetical protein
MSRRSRAWALCALAALGVAAVSTGPVPVPRAYATDAGLRFFEKGFKKMAKSCAKKAWGVAADARKSQFFQFAKEEAEFALRYDPDNKDARDYLGYVKRKDGWELDPELAAKVKPQNMKNQKEAQRSFDKRVEKWKEEKRKVRQYIAKKYAQLGQQCEKAGHGEQAVKSYERALLLDPMCDGARKGLGYKKVGQMWLTKKQIAAIQKATEGQWVTEQSRLEKALGTTLHKMESKHYRLEDDKGREAIPDAIKGLEVLYVYYLTDFSIDPATDVLEEKKLELCVVSDKALWHHWVDEISGFHDKAWLKDSNKYLNYTDLASGTLRVETAEHVDTRDPLLHNAAHLMNQTVWRTKKYAWLDEGLVYYFTVKVQETTRTHCTAKDTSGYGNKAEAIGGEKNWTVSEDWKHHLKEMVRAKNDTELRTIMGRKLAVLELPDTVKAWAVVHYLMEKEHAKFVQFLTALRDTKEDQFKAFERVFGKGIEQVDKEWRAYATRAF